MLLLCSWSYCVVRMSLENLAHFSISSVRSVSFRYTLFGSIFLSWYLSFEAVVYTGKQDVTVTIPGLFLGALECK